MRISRLYVALPLNQGDPLTLDDDSAHYLRNVLRLEKDDVVLLFNGEGGEFHCLLEEVSRKAVRVRVGEFSGRNVESSLSVHIGMGISRGDRMDLAIQKAVELGVSVITPIITERCLVQLKGEKIEQRLLHWRKIAQHAAEQSGRTIVPSLNAIENVTHWLGKQLGLRLFFDPRATFTMKSLTPQNAHLTLLTGPEGGFTEQERELAIANGFIAVRLGQRILRTETAAIAALAAAQTLWGDFNA